MTTRETYHQHGGPPTHTHTDAGTQTQIPILASDGLVLTVEAADDSHHASDQPTLSESSVSECSDLDLSW